MSITFPSIEPTARSLAGPKWPITTSTSQSGLTTRRLWGSRPAQAQLSLSFNNITDANASLILQAYNDAKGPMTEVSLPSVVFNGLSSTFQTWLTTAIAGGGMKWFFTDDPPTSESVSPGRSSVRVNLVAELRLS